MWPLGNVNTRETVPIPPLRGLSFLDRFLVVWIILAMAIGIVLGNTVSSVGPALQKGGFVGVSIPIGERYSSSPYLSHAIFKVVV
jgi:hypothetical protein